MGMRFAILEVKEEYVVKKATPGEKPKNRITTSASAYKGPDQARNK
jgi:hypothetical protein